MKYYKIQIRSQKNYQSCVPLKGYLKDIGAEADSCEVAEICGLLGKVAQ